MRERKNVLVLCDDMWHPAEVVERGLMNLPADQLEFDFMHAAKDLLVEEDLGRYDLIMITKSNQINAANTNPWFEESVTEVGPDEFRKFVENGGSLLFVHSGACYHRNLLKDQHPRFTVPDEKMKDLVGCEFQGHPLRSRMEVFPLEEAKDHPILREVEAFAERDEHYQLILAKDNIEPLLGSTSEEGEPQVSGFVRRMGKGRIVVLLPGHTLAMWKNPQFQKLMLNSIDWLTGQEEV